MANLLKNERFSLTLFSFDRFQFPKFIFAMIVELLDKVSFFLVWESLH